MLKNNITIYRIMPYRVIKVEGGFKVASPKHVFSKKPLSKSRAEKQLKVIRINYGRKSGLAFH
jgi:hypothetical protein